MQNRRQRPDQDLGTEAVMRESAQWYSDKSDNSFF
jgi:hypothetical protein